MGKKQKKFLYKIAVFLFLIVAAEVWTAGEKEDEKVDWRFSFGDAIAEAVEERMLSVWMPAFSFAEKEEGGIWRMLVGQWSLPIAERTEENGEPQRESGSLYDKIIQAEGRDEDTKQLVEDDFETPKASEGRMKVSPDMEKMLQQENGSLSGNAAADNVSQNRMPDGVSENSGGEDGNENGENNSEWQVSQNQVSGNTAAEGGTDEVFPAVGKRERKQAYQWDYYRNYGELVKEFYAVDATTMADEQLLNLDELLGKDLSMSPGQDENPQILIYHTHSQEAFADSVPGDVSDTIVGAGEYLAEILRKQYGYKVMHHTGQYDVESRDYAYSNALPEIEKLLLENPSIEIVIDLHRDAVSEGKKLVMDLDGRPTATFMFFNGLSRTRKQGAIDYLPNKYIKDNLAFSFQMQVLCNEYYPGLTRKIYLKGYRYNMHLRPRCLLVEMGAQTNTVEEIYNACIPLAHVLHMELSGEK